MTIPSGIAVSALTATGGIGRVDLAWTNGADACLSYQQRLVVEVWAGTTNNRDAAAKVGESSGNFWSHTGISRTTRYYWIRVRNVIGQFGPWHPESSTAGVSGIPSQAGAPYIDITEGVVDVGSTPGRVLIDGDNKRFVVNDGTRDRVRLGDTTGSGAYGITIYDAAGNIILSSAAGPGAGFSLPTSQVTGLGSFATLSQINSGNASTYIASAAIGSAQVGTLSAGNISVSSLSALSANLGTVNAGTINGVDINGGRYENITSSDSNPMYLEVSGSNSRCIEVWAYGPTNSRGLVAYALEPNGIGVTAQATGSAGIGVEARAAGGGAQALVVTGTSAITSNIAQVTAESTSYNAPALRVDVARAANSAFSYFVGRASGGSDLAVRLSGDGSGYCDGAWTGGGADYAEYFESADGQPLPVGASVVLVGKKVRAATAEDAPSNIMGVVRPKGASVVVGNAGWNRWKGKYLTDDYGAPLMEEYTVYRWPVQVPDKVLYRWKRKGVERESVDPAAAPKNARKVIRMRTETRESENSAEAPEGAEALVQHRRVLNPAYDPEAAYTPRSERPEWCVIGLMGQIAVTKGQPVKPTWRKMEDISANVEMWLVI